MVVNIAVIAPFNLNCILAEIYADIPTTVILISVEMTVIKKLLKSKSVYLIE